MWGNAGMVRKRMGADQWHPEQALALGGRGVGDMTEQALNLASRGVVDVTERWVAVYGDEQSSSLLHEVSIGVHPGLAAAQPGLAASRSGMAASRCQLLDDHQYSAPQVDSTACLLDDDHPVVVFLTQVGLCQYAELLVQSGFDDMETLLEIEDSDMKDIGIPRGHAVKLKKRLRDFQEGSGMFAHLPAGNTMPALEQPPPAPPVPPLPQRLGTAPPASPRCMQPTDKMKTAVEQSWEQLQTLGIEYLSELLYRDFFEHAPEAMDLFPQEVRFKYRDWSADESAGEDDLLKSPAMRKLWAKVISAVGNAVAGLHDAEQLVPRLRELGARHVNYGAEEEHLNIVSKSLMRVLRNVLGDTFTPEVEFAWTMVYSFVSAIMAGGMQAVRADLATAPALSRREAPSQRSGGNPGIPNAAAAGSGGGAATAPATARRQEVSVGREIEGGNEVYYIERHLQNAIFGDVFEATGLTSGRSFAVKVLDQDMIARFGRLQQEDHQFCESPLCEVRFAELMRGLENVLQLEDHFADQHYHFIVSELASHGDLLEGLRMTPGGFEEEQARLLISGAARGLASLHQRGLAIQDVSLENMLLHVFDDGQWQVRICDPGQGVTFTVDPVTGAEAPVLFRGFVAKEFRPPELYGERDYLATKVDSWCLGWSAFYLLCAQPLFHSASPTVEDPDWELFQQKSFPALFKKKGWRPALSGQAKDFILKLMDVDPRKRISVREALRHPWLAGDTTDVQEEVLYVSKDLRRRVPAQANDSPPQSNNASRATTGTDTTDSLDSRNQTPSSRNTAHAGGRPQTLLQRLHGQPQERAAPRVGLSKATAASTTARRAAPKAVGARR
mmetsp:Transcript_82802/g.208504  ORF Transcript_82802/g.208504 Transcript_82802/m.208504 type:complete len:842 (+) Transcript_82802:50-2575(+)